MRRRSSTGSRPPRPDALVLCAYGVLVREPLLSEYEIFNVHPSLLPRWRGAAPVERAIMAGDAETGVSIMRLTEGLDSGPVCLQGREPIRADDDYGTLAERLQALSGDLLVRALGERPPWVEQDEDGVTYAHKIEAADRALDPTRTPAEVERVVRALRPHIGARLPLPGGDVLGVLGARVPDPPEPTLAPAGGRVRADGGRLLLDCHGGALELTEIRPPGGRPMPAAAWLRGRPDPALVDFWLDPRLPDRPLDELVARAVEEWDSGEEWAPALAALGWRGTEEVLDARDAACLRRPPRALGRRLRGGPARRAGAYAARAQRSAARGDGGGRGRPARARRDRRGARPARRAVGSRLAPADPLSPRRGGPRRRRLRARRPREPAGRRRAHRADARPRSCDPRLGDVRGRRARSAGLAGACATPWRRGSSTPIPRRGSRPSTGLPSAATRAPSRRRSRCSSGTPAARMWTRHALAEAAIKLAAQTGDARFAPYLPPLAAWEGTTLERELAAARAACGLD